MNKNIIGYVKLQIPAGKATPAPPVGPALGQYGINIMQFTKEFNEKTINKTGFIIPVVITIYSNKSFSFIIKTPPVAILLKKACNIKIGSSIPNKNKVSTISEAKIKEIAKIKMPDLNTNSLNSAINMIHGTMKSMGITIKK